MNFRSSACGSDSTFKRPALDESVLLPEILVNHAKESPAHALFRYVEHDGTSKTILWADAVRAFQRAAHLVHAQNSTPAGSRPVVAILAYLGS
jgi:hypothetical protein